MADAPTLEAVYAQMLEDAKGMVARETDAVANLGNICSLIFWTLNEREARYFNWVGIYYTDTETRECRLGPFQGKTARVRIPFGSGVCGTTAEKNETTVVPNVHEFPGHIACDCDSESEIVIPIRDADGNLRAILDIDSPTLDRFQPEDVAGLEKLAELMGVSCMW